MGGLSTTAYFRHYGCTPSFALAPARRSTISLWPLARAMEIAVSPRLSLACTSALLSTRTWTRSLRPAEAAARLFTALPLSVGDRPQLLAQECHGIVGRGAQRRQDALQPKVVVGGQVVPERLELFASEVAGQRFVASLGDPEHP